VDGGRWTQAGDTRSTVSTTKYVGPSSTSLYYEVRRSLVHQSSSIYEASIK
jgi:hypothetical protein